MDSKKVYKRVAVSFVVAGFLVSGASGALSVINSYGGNTTGVLENITSTSLSANSGNMTFADFYFNGISSDNLTGLTLNVTNSIYGYNNFTNVKAKVFGVTTGDVTTLLGSQTLSSKSATVSLSDGSSTSDLVLISDYKQFFVNLYVDGDYSSSMYNGDDFTVTISAMDINGSSYSTFPSFTTSSTRQVSGGKTYITYTAITDNITDDGVITSGNAATDISSNGDEVTTLTTDTGGVSTTTVDGDTGTVTSEITTKDGTKTTINSEIKVKATVNLDGSLTQEALLSSDSEAKKVKITANTDGTTNASVETKSGVTVKVDVPVGAETTISADGSITSSVEVDSSVGGEKVAVEIKIDATTGKSSATVSQVVTINGKQVTQTFKVADYDGTTESVTEFIKTSNLRAVDDNLGGIKKTFKSNRSFFVSKANLSRETDYSEAKTVEIIPTTQWQKFEEIVLFDGKRSLKLLLGGADIVIDDERVPMVPNKEYLLPLEITEDGETTTDTNSEAVYTDGKLSLTTGWNLVSLPVDTMVDDLSIFGDYSTSWKYSDKKWSQNPTTLNKAEGIWFKMNSINEAVFSGDTYEPVVADLGMGWNLIGTGAELTNFKSNNSLEALWIFQSNKWIANPKTIYAGQGFWIKK